MDLTARRNLIERVEAMVAEGSCLVAVPLDEFFDGNTDERSIGVNLPDEKHIGLAGFRRVLMEIRHRPDVQGVFLELSEFPELDMSEDEDLWPTATKAYVITSATLTEVREWVAPLHPRDMGEGWCLNVKNPKTPVADTDMRPNHRPVLVLLL